jgi:putative acetyltransferase
MTLAPVDASQEAELMALWSASWAEVYPAIDFQARIPWFTGHMLDWQAKGGLRLGAWDQSGSLAGFILLHLADHQLDQFCVRHDLKGQGVAAFLMAEVKRLSPARIDLTVNASNVRAIRFYTREGFRRTGEGINPTSGLPTFHYRWQP